MISKVIDRVDFDATYAKYGYKLFRMSRFEEYELYAENKNFLVCDRVITFNDPQGRLMALKPDVTLSIAKNCKGDDGLEKYYYNENVYRIDEGSGEFREIMQSGLECMGALDTYSIGEVIMLAAKSLKAISNECVLDITHFGILDAFLFDCGIGGINKKNALTYLSQKNAHGLGRLCDNLGVPNDKKQSLCSLTELYGEFDGVISELEKIAPESAGEPINELKDLYSLLCSMGVGDIIRLDFSIITNSTYYNGIIFRGYINGIPRVVLSGGRYDNLLRQFGKKGGAIGFAIYLDALDALDRVEEYDVDELVIYDDSTTPKELAAIASEIINSKKSVRMAKAVREDVRAKKITYVKEGKII